MFLFARIATFALAVGSNLAAETENLPRFEAQEIDERAGRVVYAVCAADVNGDGRTDVCALTEDALVWYENPSWTPHRVLEGATQALWETEADNVCFQPLDIDGDGDLDFAIGADWRPTDTSEGGSLQWARQEADGSWNLFPIGSEPTLHRIRWANVKGDDRPELIVAPLQGRGTQPPNWGEGQGVRVLVYSIPDEPAQDDWPVEVANDALHTTHNLWPVDWDDDQYQEILIAAWEGVFLIDRAADGDWSLEHLGAGNQETERSKGSSEVKLGRLRNGDSYSATIEPWHGHQVVVYTRPEDGSTPWNRSVIDEPLRSGHAVWTADLDDDTDEELIIGHRNENADGSGPGLFVYDPVADRTPISFRKITVDDGGVAVEDAVAADLNGDGLPELIAGGRATHNVRIYWNRTRDKPEDDSGSGR